MLTIKSSFIFDQQKAIHFQRRKKKKVKILVFVFFSRPEREKYTLKKETETLEVSGKSRGVI